MILTTAAVIQLLLSPLFAGEAATPWSRDFDVAKAKATAEDKLLLVVFTGHGWCHACTLLDQEVFQTPEFLAATKSRFVLLELDFNFGDGAEEAAREKTLMHLRRQYLAPAVPTVMVADGEGRPCAFITGYESEQGVESVLKVLDAAESACDARDAHASAAKQESGLRRARALDSALKSLSPLLGPIEHRGDDPILRFYGQEVEEILDLTDRTGPIAESYLDRQRRRGEWLSSEAVFANLETFNATKDYPGAISYLDGCLASNPKDAIRWRLESSRQVYLEWSNRNADALANCRRVLAIEPIPTEWEKSFRDREAFNLFALHRYREGIVHYDKRIAAADREEQLRLLYWKGQLIDGHAPGLVDESIRTWSDLRTAADPESQKWISATKFLATSLRRAGRHTESMELVDALLERDRNPWNLMDAAECNIALKRFRLAESLIRECQQHAKTLSASARKSERDVGSALTLQIEKLRAAMSQSTGPSKEED